MTTFLTIALILVALIALGSGIALIVHYVRLGLNISRNSQ